MPWASLYCARWLTEDFFAALPELQTKVNDRALIRAIHFYNDNHRVEDAVSCLEQGNFDGFLADINASGRSSFMYNQNVFTTKNPTDQRLKPGAGHQRPGAG